MKKIGSILLAIAALSLLGALFSAGRDADTAGGRFMGALILGSIGFLLLYLGNKKENTKSENSYRTTNQNQVSAPQESFWQRYKRLNPTKACAIESISGRNMAMQSDKDAQELVSSMERWARNIGCDIQEIKTEYLKSFKSAFDNENTKDILEHLKKVKYTEEANYFHISQSNTCTYFMIQWLTEDMQKQSTKSNTNAIQSRNRMSARELVISEKASLQFVENPNTGKIFFVCGNKKGYVSPAAVEKMETGSLDDFCYAEVSRDGKTNVPCLMLVNKPIEKIIRSFDVENENTTEKHYGLESCRSSKKLEIERQLYSLMLHFIQTEYGDISVTANNKDDLNILSIPLTNARICYEDNESFIHTCNLYGLDYSEILEEVSKQLIDYYMNKNKQEDTDLPF